MEECHDPGMEMLERFFDILPNMKKERALDAACGDGRLTNDFLSRKFDKIDMFDQSPDAFDIISNLKKHIKQIDDVQLVSM